MDVDPLMGKEVRVVSQLSKKIQKYKRSELEMKSIKVKQEKSELTELCKMIKHELRSLNKEKEDAAT